MKKELGRYEWTQPLKRIRLSLARRRERLEAELKEVTELERKLGGVQNG